MKIAAALAWALILFFIAWPAHSHMMSIIAVLVGFAGALMISESGGWLLIGAHATSGCAIGAGSFTQSGMIGWSVLAGLTALIAFAGIWEMRSESRNLRAAARVTHIAIIDRD